MGISQRPEAEKERMVKPTANQKRIRRALLWTPCILVCVLSMFAPEMAAIASRLTSNRVVRFSAFRVWVSPTWFIDQNGNTGFSAMTAPGIGRIGFRRYWRRQVPVSDMGFYLVPHPEENLTHNVLLDDDTILAKHSFVLGNESVICWDLVEHNKFVGPRPNDPSMALIRCTGDTEHFYAYFDGWRGDTAVFYNTLQGLGDAR
jgi:hypothetical protein